MDDEHHKDADFQSELNDESEGDMRRCEDSDSKRKPDRSYTKMSGDESICVQSLLFTIMCFLKDQDKDLYNGGKEVNNIDQVAESAVQINTDKEKSNNVRALGTRYPNQFEDLSGMV